MGLGEESERRPTADKALLLFHRRIGAAGLKSTRQRDAIVETFFELDQHISLQELHDAVKEEHPQVGYATVYRTMKILVDNEMAQPRDFGDGITRYDPLLGKSDRHDHLICVDCRKVFEFKDATLDARQKEIAQSLGSFRLIRRKLELYAACTDPNCERKSD